MGRRPAPVRVLLRKCQDPRICACARAGDPICLIPTPLPTCAPVPPRTKEARGEALEAAGDDEQVLAIHGGGDGLHVLDDTLDLLRSVGGERLVGGALEAGSRKGQEEERTHQYVMRWVAAMFTGSAGGGWRAPLRTAAP